MPKCKLCDKPISTRQDTLYNGMCKRCYRGITTEEKELDMAIEEEWFEL